MHRFFYLLFLSTFLLHFISPNLASESDHKYSQDESITLWVNKVGPYNNPQETYNYYSLPFCQLSGNGNAAHKWGGLGEVLGGNELIDSQIDIKYRKNVEKSTICELELDPAKVKQFKDAIENTYWFEFFIDDLPLWGYVGELHPDKNNDNTKHVLYTHKSITFRYNEDQIIHVNLTQENPKPLEAGKTIDMTYSVKWIPTNITFGRRFDVYLDYPFFEHQKIVEINARYHVKLTALRSQHASRREDFLRRESQGRQSHYKQLISDHFPNQTGPNDPPGLRRS